MALLVASHVLQSRGVVGAVQPKDVLRELHSVQTMEENHAMFLGTSVLVLLAQAYLTVELVKQETLIVIGAPLQTITLVVALDMENFLDVL